TLTSCACLETQAPGAGQHPQILHRRVTRTFDSHYLLFLPAGFQAHGAQKYPLLIFLHGSGEAGDDLDRVKVQGPPKIVESRPDFPFIVASPQTPDDSIFDPATLDAMLDELIEHYPVDPDRVYLTGLSLGGEWTYGWAGLRPERFAAIAPVSGEWTTAVDCRLKHVPVWAFHGAVDDVVPLAQDQAMVQAINDCGGDARMTVYPDTGHDAWTQAYATEELYAWLLRHRRYREAH
ncbi:MAG: prolyl oligopeptidase family serine peptidase, partial [Steroidobacteraceae bacterium]